MLSGFSAGSCPDLEGKADAKYRNRSSPKNSWVRDRSNVSGRCVVVPGLLVACHLCLSSLSHTQPHSLPQGPGVRGIS